MSEAKPNVLAELATHLEDHFYAPCQAEFAERRRVHEELGDRAEELRSLGIVMNETAINRMVELQIRPTTWAAIFLIPLIEVGWADDKLDRRERNVVMRTAEANGVIEGSLTHRVLEAWFERRPSEQLFDSWMDYVRALCGSMRPQERDGLCDELLARSHDVANASGGFFGMRDKLSSEENQVIRRLWAAFTSER